MPYREWLLTKRIGELLLFEGLSFAAAAGVVCEVDGDGEIYSDGEG